MSKIIDFRSDASTQPTPAMRQAMAEADVGNHDYDEDPTIHRLERTIAEWLHKDDAVFVHSGTMANLCAVMSHIELGDCVLIGQHFHIFDYEGPAMQRVAGCPFHTMEEVTEGGRTRLLYEKALLGDQSSSDSPRLLCLENSVSRLGGTLLTAAHLKELSSWAQSHKMSLHLDGARLFNASVALGVEASELARFAETVSVALTKAVGAPAGAVVAGSEEVAERIRRNRWMLGGNWKQGGVVAAACLQGLRSVDEAITVDHRNARRLAESLNALDECRVDLDRVVTNILFLELADPSLDAERLRSDILERGFAFGRWKPGSVEGVRRSRLVTHRDISREDVDRFVEALKEALVKQRPRTTGRITSKGDTFAG